jgi:DNA-binding transcriptional regulator GbsR (MarR family)
MDGKGFISNPYLNFSSAFLNFYWNSKSREIDNKLEIMKDQIYEKLKEELREEFKKELLKVQCENHKKDEWERIGSPDIK